MLNASTFFKIIKIRVLLQGSKNWVGLMPGACQIQFRPLWFYKVASTSGQLRSIVILLMGDNEMALFSIEWVYRVKECTPTRSC